MSETPSPPPIEEPPVERVRVPDHRPLPAERRRLALAIAIAADIMQWIAFPLFLWGVASPWNDALDLIVAVVMIRLVGFHWAFLPTFLAELIPFVGLVPTWTAAVWLATRRST
jgi:hypothetical protein